jgi:hypothetical protein
MFGGEGTDSLVGGAARDQIWGGPGNDSLLGEDGNDSLRGEAGADALIGGLGNDQIIGGADDDRIEARDGARDGIHCGPGNDTAIVDLFERSIDESCEENRLDWPEIEADVGVNVAAQIAPGISMRITAVTPNASAIIPLVGGRLNSVGGRQPYMLTVEVVNDTGAPVSLPGGWFTFQNQLGTRYDEYDTGDVSCGTLPSQITNGPLATGTSGGNLCWNLELAEVGSFFLLVDRPTPDYTTPRGTVYIAS